MEVVPRRGIHTISVPQKRVNAGQTGARHHRMKRGPRSRSVLDMAAAERVAPTCTRKSEAVESSGTSDPLRLRWPEHRWNGVWTCVP